MIFTSSLSDWNFVASKIEYSWDSSGTVIINVDYDDSENAPAGWTYWTFSSGTLIDAEVYMNTLITYYSANGKRSVACHELGHGLSLGHILTPDIALMGFNPNIDVYYLPQPIDISLVNGIYK